MRIDLVPLALLLLVLPLRIMLPAAESSFVEAQRLPPSITDQSQQELMIQEEGTEFQYPAVSEYDG